MSLYVCGDTHGDYDIYKLTSKRFDSKALTKNDYVLVCGDCAAIWGMDSQDAYIQKWYNSKNWTTLYIDGNHENHEALDELPVVEWNGGKVHMISDSIIHLMRGQVYTIDGHKIFTMGGAESHDKEYRIEGMTWWDREMPSEEEYAEALSNLKKNDNEVEYIFTHCASDNTQDKISDYFSHDKLTNFFRCIDEDIKFKHWYCGHYHVDQDIDEKHSVLYDRVIKLW